MYFLVFNYFISVHNLPLIVSMSQVIYPYLLLKKLFKIFEKKTLLQFPEKSVKEYYL